MGDANTPPLPSPRQKKKHHLTRRGATNATVEKPYQVWRAYKPKKAATARTTQQQPCFCTTTTIPLIQARQSRAKSAVTHNNNPNKMRPKRSYFAISLSLSLSLSLFALCLGEDGRGWCLRCERGDGLLDRIHGLQATVIGLAVWKGETASWTEMMACNSRGCDRVFSVKRG